MDGGVPQLSLLEGGARNGLQWLVSRGWGSPAHAPFSGSRLGLMPTPRRSKGRAGALRRRRARAPVPRALLSRCAGPPLPALGLRCSARNAQPIPRPVPSRGPR